MISIQPGKGGSEGWFPVLGMQHHQSTFCIFLFFSLLLLVKVINPENKHVALEAERGGTRGSSWALPFVNWGLAFIICEFVKSQHCFCMSSVR